MLRSALKAENWDIARAFAAPAAQAAEASRRLVERYGGDQACRRSATELDTLLNRLRLVNFAWEKVEPADRLNVAWVLWSGVRPPAEHPTLLHDFLDWLETPHHRYQMARLAMAWAAAFDPRLPSMRIVGDWLTSHLMWLTDPWRGLAARFQIFAIDRASDALADALLQTNKTAAQFFAAERLPESAVRGGLGIEILAAAIARIEGRSAQARGLAAGLCDLALTVGMFEPAAEPRITARRNALLAPLAEALLLPWISAPPPRDVKAAILTFLVRHYGDMRVSPQRWRALRQPAIALMHRWLTEETVVAYFRLAGRAKSVERTRLAERAQFWMSRLATIDGAWLLTAAHDVPGDASQMAYGRLGGRPDQVALLLRVGDLTVLEAAHETNERIWLGDNPFAPSLYQHPDYIYWPASLAQGVDFSSAYGAERPQAWQTRLAGFLERNAAEAHLPPSRA